nr:integrase, catalytic region, zinc finger, CCHC-type, peptidase aspartic, catalytic [Tanacetum cinerariifolium]
MKSLKEKVEDKLIKQDQSLQTVHMLCRPGPNSNELNRVAIGYKNPLCLTRAKQVQSALYNGHEIIKGNHKPTIVHDTKDTLEITKITRKKMNDKMNDPECVTRKLKSEALKERTKVSRPMKAFTVYPLNTPAKLVPKVLPTKNQGMLPPRGHSFYKTLKDNFKGIQKALTKEVKEMKDVFKELEAEVTQYVVDRKRDAIELKNLLITNDNLIDACLSQEVFCVATNSELNVARFTEMHVANTTAEARCLALEAELANLRDINNHDNKKELINNFSKLELKYQNLKVSIGNNPPTPHKDTLDFDSVFVIGKMQASLQGKDNVIRQLKKQLSQLQMTHSDTDRTLRVQPTDSQITKLTDQVTHLQAQNDLFMAENDKIKQHYKELNNRDAHLDYLRHLKESVETIHDIVEEAKVPKSHVKSNRISPAKGVNKLSVEDQPRTNKSHFRTSNRADSSSRLKRTVINLNSDSMCQTGNKCLTSSNHDMCVATGLQSVVATLFIYHNCSVKRKGKQVWKPKQVRQVWKPTGKVLTAIGHQWRPTDRIFNLGNQFPLTRFTPPKVVSTKPNKKRANKMADLNAPSGQTPAMAPPLRVDAQILPHIKWVPIGKSNCYLDLEKSQSNPIYKIAVDLLKNTNFFRAFTASSTIPSIYIQQFWDTIVYDKKAGCYMCQLDEQWFILSKETLREALHITPVNNDQAFAAPPSIDGLIDFVNQLGYPKLVKNLSNVVTNDLFQPWRALLTIINLCLTGKTSGFERPRALVLQILWGVVTRTNIDYAERIWEEFTQSIHTFIKDKQNLSRHTSEKKRATLIVIPSIRFTKQIIHHLQRRHRFHPRPDSLLHLANEELFLGYLKFSAKGMKREVFGMPIPGSLITVKIQQASYYREYMAKVAQHRRYLAGETGGVQDPPAPKPTQPVRKPKTRAPKAPSRPSVSIPVRSAQPAPTSALANPQEKKHKQAAKTSDKPPKEKKSKHGRVSKKRSRKNVEASKTEEVPTVEPQVSDEDAEYQKVLEESMKDAYTLPRGTLPTVVIREPESGKYQPLPEVPGKGKAKVTEEQTGSDAGAQAEDQTGSDAGAQAKGQAGSNPDETSEGQAGSNPDETSEGQAGSNPDETSEGQAGPDPGDAEAKVQSITSLVVHAGSDREHMDLDVANVSPQPSTEQLDEGFIATAYPKVQENLKLAIEEHVLLEEPASSSGTLSSLQHLKAMMVKRIGELEHIMVDLIRVNKDMEERLDSHGSRLYTPKQLDIPQQVSITELAQDMAEARKKKKKSRVSSKTPPGSLSHQPPPPPSPAGPSRASGALGASGSVQVPPPPSSSTNQESPSKGFAAPSPSKTAASAEYQAWTTTDIRLRPSISLNPADLEMDEDMAPNEQAQSSDDEDIRSAHIPTVNLRQGWWKPFEEERPATLEPAWSIRSSDVPVLTKNWASALASNYSPPPEDLILAQTGNIATFMDWFCKRRGITELKPQDLEGPAYEIIKFFHPDVIHLQYQMEECHKLLTDSVDDPILRHNVSKPLSLGGPPGQVTIQSEFFFNKDLEYLRYVSKGRRPALSISKMKAAYYHDAGLEQMVLDQFWIKEECKYDIPAMYGISHWWFQRQRFYIDQHTSEGDRSAVRTHMRILSVVRIEVFSMYGYDYMKKIVLRRADLNEYVIAKRDFKYMYPSDFKDLYLLNLQGHLNHLPPKDKKILTTAANLWTRQLDGRGSEQGIYVYYSVAFKDKEDLPQPGKLIVCIEELAKAVRSNKIKDQMLVLTRRQVETELKLAEKFRELGEEVSTVVKEREDVVEELERLSANHMAEETDRLLRRRKTVI